MSNVGDVDVESATTGITSIIKGFGMDVSQTEHVTDVLVDVGQKYAISAEELMEAFERGGASMAASNTSFEKSAALFAATNASLQNAAKTGTLWNTVSARIRSATKELEDMGESTEDLAGGFSKYREELIARTGVDVQDAAGNYRDLYDIFVDIAAVWDDLADDQSRARVGEILGGTRNQAGIMSTIQNIADAKGAYQTALSADGVAARANDKYMETTAAHIEQLSASFQELSTSVFQSDVMKGFVDGLRTVVEAINMIADAFSKLGSFGIPIIGGLALKFGSLPGPIAAFVTKLGLSIPMLGQFAAAGLAIMAVVAVIDALTVSFDEAREKATQAAEAYNTAKSELETTNSELETTKKRIEELENKKLTPIEQKELNTLRQYNDELERQKIIQERTAKIYQEEAARASYAAYNKKKYRVNDPNNPNGALLETDIIDEINRYSDVISNQQDEYDELGESMIENANRQKELETKLASYAPEDKKEYTLMDKLNNKPLTEYQKDLAEYNQLIKEYKDASERRSDLTSKMSEAESARTEQIRLADEFLSSMKDENGNALRPEYEELITRYEQAIHNTLSEDERTLSDFQSWLSGYDEKIQNTVNNALSTINTEGWSLDELKDYANGVMNGDIEISFTPEVMSNNLEQAKAGLDNYTKGLAALQEALNSQSTGKSLSLDTYNSSELKDYTSALEYHNGALQYNLDKVQEITAAKAEEEKATIATDKAQAQSQYLKNAAEIERLRGSLDNLGDSSGNARAQIESQISSLLEQNSTIVETCTQYDLMSASINEATNAYQNWINAQSASESGDMFDSARSAFEKIDGVLTGDDGKKNQKGSKNISEDYRKIGRTDYKAAVDFVVPDTIDHEDAAAVDAYVKSVAKYFTYDENGAMDGLDTDFFLNEAVNKGLMTLDSETGEYKVAGEKTMASFADGLNLSLPLVQAIFGELEEYGLEFSWADEAPKTMGDLAVEANEAAEALRQTKEFSDLKLVLDVTQFEDSNKAVQALDDNIEKMNKVKSKVKIDSSEAEYANSVIRYCVAQKQALTAPAVMHVDTSQVSGAVGEALSLLQQFQELQNTKELMLEVDSNADTSEVDAAIQEVQGKLKGIEAEAKLGVDTSSVDSIQSYIDGLSFESMVALGVDPSAVDGYIPENKDADAVYGVDSSKVDSWDAPDKDAKVRYDVDASAVNAYNPENLTRYVHYYTITHGASSNSGGNSVNGTAHAAGTAAAGGNWGTAPGGPTLTGELGREIVVDPITGRWYTVGDNGAEFVNIPKGAIVFNHKQTEALLENGYVAGRGISMACGTAMVTGGGKLWKGSSGSSGSSNSGSSSSSSSSSGSGSGTHHRSSSSDNDSSSSSTDKALDKFKDWISKLFDWIEVRIKRVQEKIDRYVDRAKWATESGYYGTAASNYRNAVNATVSQIDNEIAGSARYNKQAERVLSKAVSSGLISGKEASTIRTKDANGTIEISEYSEKVREVIKDYQTWKDKARSAQSAIEDLHQKIREYINDLKKARDAQRDLALDTIKKRLSTGGGGTKNTTAMSNKQLSYNNAQLLNQNKAYSNEVSYLSSDINKLASGAAGSINGQLKASNLNKIKNSKEREAYKKALKTAKSYMWSQKLVPDSILNTIKKYSVPVYNKIYAYNIAIGKLEEARMEQAVNYADTSADIYKNIAEIYKNTDDKTEADISLIKQKSDNVSSVSSKNKYLDNVVSKYNTILSNDNKEIKEYENRRKKSASAIAAKNITTSRFSGLSDKTRANYQKVINSAKNAAKAGKYIDPSTISALATYYSKGYITAAFYQACVDYNNALDSKNQAIAQRDIDAETLRQQKIAAGKEKFSNVENAYQIRRDAIGAKTELIQSRQSTKTTRGLSLNERDYGDLLSQNQEQQTLYRREIAALQSVINSNLKNGYWTTSTNEYRDAMTALNNYRASLQDCITEQEEYNNAIAQLPYDTIEKALDLLDSVADYTKASADLKTARGQDLDKTDYTDQIQNNTDKLKKYAKERAQAYADYLKAMASSSKVYGGKTSDEWLELYNNIGTTIKGIQADTEALKDALRDDVYWRTFERAHDEAERFHKVLSGIIDLIDDDMYFDENGALTSFGISQVANLVKEYETARQEVTNYSNDIKNLNKLYGLGQYTTEEYKEKLAELQEKLMNSAGDMKGYIEDIKEIYKDLDKAELDALYKLIDARNKALSAKKDYYDYDKTIRSKTKDIQELTAQLAALEGIDTAEAKAKRAKLQEELSTAQEDLEDTKRDHALKLSQDALSDLKTTLGEEFDNKWESLGRDLEKMASLLEDANTLAETNSSLIYSTLTNLLAFYGINAKETGVDAKFASGTKRVRGSLIGLSNESGNEIIVTDNGIISRFNPGNGIVPADMTERIYELAQSVKPNSSLGKTGVHGIAGGIGSVEIAQHYDSLIHVDGNADSITVSDLKRLSKDILEKSYDYTTTRIKQDYVRTGGTRRV